MPIAAKKIHFAPMHHQEKVISTLLRQGRFKNVSEFMRKAVDHYLDALGRPPLAEQARRMASEWQEQNNSGDRLQASSMQSTERW